MRIVVFKGRPVDLVQVDSHSGYIEDLFVLYAYFSDTGEDLTEDEMDELARERPDAVEALWFGMRWVD